MANNYFGIPGPGDSLGQCSVCGESFIMECVLGKSVKSFCLNIVDNTMFAHDKCLKIMEKFDGRDGEWWKELPEKSPLRFALERADEAKPTSAGGEDE